MQEEAYNIAEMSQYHMREQLICTLAVSGTAC